MIRKNGVGQFVGYSLQNWKVILKMTVLEILMQPWIWMNSVHCFPFQCKQNTSWFAMFIRSIVSPLSLFLSTCVWIYSTELCINHIRLRITENRGLSYPGQCSLLGHYQRLEDNAENRFLFSMYACKCLSAPSEIKSCLILQCKTSQI